MTPHARPSADTGETRFVTGEAVHLDVRVARLGSRVMARLIDLLAQVACYWALSTLFGLLLVLASLARLVTLDGAAAQVATLLLPLILTLVVFPVVQETASRGRSAGKLILGLRVVRDDGGPITFRHSLTRTLVAVATDFPGLILPPVTWLVTVWTMVASPRSKRIGDHAAGTVVIHERTPSAWGWVPQMPPGLATWANTLDLTGLDDELALSVRNYLARNRAIREPARTELGHRLAREVAAVTNPPPPPNTAGWAYLAAVHAERHQRALRRLAAVRGRAATVWPDLGLTASIALPRPVALVPTPRPPVRPSPPPGPPTPRPASPSDHD